MYSTFDSYRIEVQIPVQTSESFNPRTCSPQERFPSSFPPRSFLPSLSNLKVMSSDSLINGGTYSITNLNTQTVLFYDNITNQGKLPFWVLSLAIG